jgi:hypothetical protein
MPELEAIRPDIVRETRVHRGDQGDRWIQIIVTLRSDGVFTVNGRELGKGPEGITVANWMLSVMLNTLVMVAGAKQQTGE